MRVLHVFRTPVGGLFRHVRDVTRGLAGLGHEAGIICDSTTGGGAAEKLLASAEQHCALGIHRIPISRLPGLGDVSGARLTAEMARKLRPDIIHCHGAKGGLYGRLAARKLGVPSVYTPHGGSLHYSWASPSGAVFLGAEKYLASIGSGFHFVCNFERDAFAAKIGIGAKPHRVIYNGLWPEEFGAVTPEADATDVLFIGDMRTLKGVDLLIEALAELNRDRRVSATLVGDGPDLARFQAQARSLGLADLTRFPGRLAAAEAFRLGRILVLPSRNESFPYVVLEACAAGIPLLASRVGGIPEILTPEHLFSPGSSSEIAARTGTALRDPAALQAGALAMRMRIMKDFTASGMVNGVVSLYRDLGAG